jgi:exonuclease SbcD
MKLLHTSDWHLGRTLYAKKERSREQAAFLAWLLTTIKAHAVDLLLIAGDVFDSAAPGSGSQKMYYDFLLNVRHSGCRQVIVIGGNHDSPGFLNAPKEILSTLRVQVVGQADEVIADEVIVVDDAAGVPAAIVCAAPFLRERDLIRFAEGEAPGDRSQRIAAGIRNHYASLAQAAERRRQELGGNLPVIATGHLSVAGGKKTGDDGVRDIYIGTIECVGSETFPSTFDYVALGHYHIASPISDTIRYCGSPIPMGFGEAGQEKCVYLVDFDKPKDGRIERLPIPVFQHLASLRGNRSQIDDGLTRLLTEGQPVWVEIIYEGNDVFPDLLSWVNEKTAETPIEVINVQNRQHINDVLTANDTAQSLDQLDEQEVFARLLNKTAIADEQQTELKDAYNEILSELTANNA